jgi:hypothetical protein
MSAMIKELDRVVLATALPEYGLKPGDIGTVVHAYADGLAYEVEFLTLDGETIAVATLEREGVRPVGGEAVAHARPLSLPAISGD